MPTQPTRPIFINSSDVSAGPPDNISITNMNLVNALVRDQAAVLQFLSSEVSPVNLEEISIDNDGRVVVANSTFAKTLRDGAIAADQASGMKQTGCGFGC